MLNMKYIYMPTHTRYGPWLVGVLLGYFLHRTKEVRLDMNKVSNNCRFFYLYFVDGSHRGVIVKIEG